jgi:hypothetical protein
MVENSLMRENGVESPPSIDALKNLPINSMSEVKERKEERKHIQEMHLEHII